MKRNFLELRNFLNHRYPELQGSIVGQNYPAPAYAALATTAASSIQVGAVVMMIFGNQLFATMGMPPPQLYKDMVENKMATFCGVFFMNSMANSLTTTGAFEVELDGKVIYSKLETGFMPNGRQIMEAIERAGIGPGEGAAAIE